MDEKPLLNDNETNEEEGQNSNQQENTQNSLDSNNQNDKDQILINTNSNESTKSQSEDNAKQGQGFILPSDIDFSKYKNLNELNHMRINQVDDNIFIISKTTWEKKKIILSYLIKFLIMIIVITTALILGGQFVYYVAPVNVTLTVILLIVALYTDRLSVNFILGPKDITVEEYCYCKKRITTYEPGQLSKVELTCQFIKKCCRNKHYYKISFIKDNDGVPEEVAAYFKEKNKHQIYTSEEIGFFNYVMNRHIESKMKLETIN